jgi:hypothetical protein
MRNTIQWHVALAHFVLFIENIPEKIDEECVGRYHAVLKGLEEFG